MNTDWHDIIQRYIAGTLADEESAALQDALKADAELRALYLDYMNLDVALEAAAGAAEMDFDPSRVVSIPRQPWTRSISD